MNLHVAFFGVNFLYYFHLFVRQHDVELGLDG